MQGISAFKLSGLRLWPADSTWVTGMSLTMVGVTAFVIALDCWLFRGHLSADYLRIYTGPLAAHTPALCILAAFEELKYRLLIMTALVVALTALWGRAPPWWAMALIIVGVQAVNVAGPLIADPGYASLRYLAVGSAWGWLYWRYGWSVALVGHATCHLVLDPLLLIGLQA